MFLAEILTVDGIFDIGIDVQNIIIFNYPRATLIVMQPISRAIGRSRNSPDIILIDVCSRILPYRIDSTTVMKSFRVFIIRL